MTKRRITLQKILANPNQEVWVRNRVSTFGKGPGVLIISVRPDDPNGIIIPPGNDPVCLTDQIDPESLRGCRDLFRLVNKGALELLDPEEADAYYAANTDRKEKLAEKMKKYLEKPLDAKAAPDVVKFSQDTDAVNAKLPGLCLKAKKQSLAEADMFEVLFENQDGFKENDFVYLSTHGHFDSVKKWAKEHLTIDKE